MTADHYDQELWGRYFKPCCVLFISTMTYLSLLKLRSNRRIFGPYVIPKSGGILRASLPTIES
jgi:hypothetical protein